jgi:hypothetical protein
VKPDSRAFIDSDSVKLSAVLPAPEVSSRLAEHDFCRGKLIDFVLLLNPESTYSDRCPIRTIGVVVLK